MANDPDSRRSYVLEERMNAQKYYNDSQILLDDLRKTTQHDSRRNLVDTQPMSRADSKMSNLYDRTNSK